MDPYEIGQVLTRMISPLLEANGFELIELRCMRKGSSVTVLVLIDRIGGGISMDDCAGINKTLGLALETQDIIPGHYILEVSSPGIDRILMSKKDFSRALNRKVQFFLTEPVNGKIEWIGVINGIDEENLRVDIKGQEMLIPLSKINKAKQVL